MNDIIVRIIDLPLNAKGFTAESPDGVYNVYLNARQSYETQYETFLHELRHIEEYDFESDKPIWELETE